jgi:hypothetical protein
MAERAQNILAKSNAYKAAAERLGSVVEAIDQAALAPYPRLDPLKAATPVEVADRIINLPTVRGKLELAMVKVSQKIEMWETQIQDQQAVREKLDQIRELVANGQLPEAYLRMIEGEIAGSPSAKAQETPTVVPPVEKPKAKEDEKKVFVDVDKRTVEVDGKIIKITGEISWPVFMILAKNARIKIEGARLDRLGKRLGSVDERPGVSAVFSIKRVFRRHEVDPDALITRWGQGDNIRYKFNRKVEFSDPASVGVTSAKLEGSEAVSPVGHGVGRKRASEDIKTNQIALPDGQVVSTNVERIALGMIEIFEHNAQNPIGRDALIELMLGNVDEKSIAQLWRDIYTMRQLIKPLGWKIEQLVSVMDMHLGEQAKYFPLKIAKDTDQGEIGAILAGIAGSGIVTGAADKSESGEEVGLPVVLIDQTSDVLTIDGRTVHLKVGGNTRKLFEYIAKRAPDGVTVSELNRVVREFGSQIVVNPGQIIIGDIRKKIEVDFKNPKLLVREGSVKGSSYRLAANVTFVGDSTNNQVAVPSDESTGVEGGASEKPVLDIKLAPGQTLREVDGVYLVCEGNYVVEEFTIVQEKGEAFASAVIADQDEELTPASPAFSSDSGSTMSGGNLGGDPGEESDGASTAISASGQAEDRSAPVPSPLTDEFRVIPYEATVDEILSGEEAKVLSVNHSIFYSTRHNCAYRSHYSDS